MVDVAQEGDKFRKFRLAHAGIPMDINSIKLLKEAGLMTTWAVHRKALSLRHFLVTSIACWMECCSMP